MPLPPAQGACGGCVGLVACWYLQGRVPAAWRRVARRGQRASTTEHPAPCDKSAGCAALRLLACATPWRRFTGSCSCRGSIMTSGPAPSTCSGRSLGLHNNTSQRGAGEGGTRELGSAGMCGTALHDVCDRGARRLQGTGKALGSGWAEGRSFPVAAGQTRGERARGELRTEGVLLRGRPLSAAAPGPPPRRGLRPAPPAAHPPAAAPLRRRPRAAPAPLQRRGCCGEGGGGG